MIKNIAIVSLSRGVAGEAFAQHEVEIGLQRLAGYGVNAVSYTHLGLAAAGALHQPGSCRLCPPGGRAVLSAAGAA